MLKLKQYITTHQEALSFLMILFCSGFICGILLLNYFDEKEITSLSNYLTTLPSETVDKQAFFASQVFINSLFLIGICILGFALFAIPLIAFVMFTKGIQIGFSCAMYYYMYQLKGIGEIILTLFPQVIFDTIAFIIVASGAIEISIVLFYALFNGTKYPFTSILNKILTDLLIGLTLILISNFIKSTFLL